MQAASDYMSHYVTIRHDYSQMHVAVLAFGLVHLLNERNYPEKDSWDFVLYRNRFSRGFKLYIQLDVCNYESELYDLVTSTF